MPKLSQLKAFQIAFSQELLKKNTSEIALVKKDQLKERVKIYQNNVYSSLTDVLKNRYTVVNELVGDEFFNVLCRQYITQHPPYDPAMHLYGEALPSFIAEHKDKHQIDFLADIATLESAQHNAYYTPDQPCLTPEHIATLPIDQLMQSRVKFHASLTLIQSPFSTFSIWHAISNRHTFDQNPNTPENIFIFRQDLNIQTLCLSEGYTFFIDLLLKGFTLSDAVEKLMAFNSSEKIEPTQAISFLIQTQLITDFIQP